MSDSQRGATDQPEIDPQAPHLPDDNDADNAGDKAGNEAESDLDNAGVDKN